MKKISIKQITALTATSLMVISLCSATMGNIARADQSQVTPKEGSRTQTDLSYEGSRNWELTEGIPLEQEVKDGAVTYKIDTDDPHYKKAYEDAVKDWNSLGIIRLVQVDSNQEITMTGSIGQNINKKVNGVAYYDTEIANPEKGYYYIRNARTLLTGHMTSADPNKKSSQLLFKDVAEHEIGHALGFGHDNSIPKGDDFQHIMNESLTPFYAQETQPLGSYEQKTLFDHYQNQLNGQNINIDEDTSKDIVKNKVSVKKKSNKKVDKRSVKKVNNKLYHHKTR